MNMDEHDNKFGCLNNLGYSLRRSFIDEFLTRQIGEIKTGGKVLDLGGVNENKRGIFDVDAYGLDAVCVNVSNKKHPDVLGDGAVLPFADASFDAVICSEMLEHVPDPIKVLKEAHRVSRPGGLLLCTVPFLFRIHGDPEDYGRYTAHYWRETLNKCGFTGLEIEKQGLFWSVLADMLRGHVVQLLQGGRLRLPVYRHIVVGLTVWFSKKALSWDRRQGLADHIYYGNHTTGFGIRAQKSPST